MQAQYYRGCEIQRDLLAVPMSFGFVPGTIMLQLKTGPFLNVCFTTTCSLYFIHDVICMNF